MSEIVLGPTPAEIMHQSKPESLALAIDFDKLLQVDVTQLMKKKKKFTYLSWAWAVIEMRRRAPFARWWPHIFANGHLYDMCPDGSCIVACYVQLAPDEPAHFMHLAVLEETNRAITEALIYREGEEAKVNAKPWVNQKRKPGAADISNSLMRCLAKNVSQATGIALHLYAGEDLPFIDDDGAAEEPTITQQDINEFQTNINMMFEKARDFEEVKQFARAADPMAVKLGQRKWLADQVIKMKEAIASEFDEAVSEDEDK